MSIDTVHQAIATVLRTVPGINAVYEHPPRAPLTDAELPAFMIFSRGANYDWVILGASMNTETRDYGLRFYLAPQPETLDTEGESRVPPWITTIKDILAAKPQLGLTAGIQRSILLRDTGPTILPWANTNYWGVEFTLQVTEYDARTYASYE